MKSEINVYRILSVKEISALLETSENNAKKIKNDIKNELNVPIVLMKHFKDYFKIT
jgi:hypothetical protein